jgi:hypothetical protein
MDWEWGELLLRAAQRRNEADEKEFARLLERVEGKCDADAARILMKTFSAQEDFGTQELVISALASCDPHDRVTALLEELPRLTVECPEWAHILVSDAIGAHSQELIDTAKLMSPQAKASLRLVLEQQDFLDLSPLAEIVRSQAFGA